MRYWATSGQIDPGYFVAALLRCCFGVVQVAGWQPLHGAGKGELGFPTGVPLPQVPVSSKAEAEMVGEPQEAAFGCWNY